MAGQAGTPARQRARQGPGQARRRQGGCQVTGGECHASQGLPHAWQWKLHEPRARTSARQPEGAVSRRTQCSRVLHKAVAGAAMVMDGKRQQHRRLWLWPLLVYVCRAAQREEGRHWKFAGQGGGG